MSRPHPSDDPELRKLLDSIGINEADSAPDTLTDVEVERAERMLARIVSQPRQLSPQTPPARSSIRQWWTHRTWSMNLTVAAAVCVLVVMVVAVQPWGGAPTAYAQTPAMLHFADVRAGEIRATGEPAGDLLRGLAESASKLPEPGNLPVQHVEVDGWWASSAPEDDDTTATTVLTPIHSDVYLLPTHERRAIERRGEPLDADGQIASVDPDWTAVPATSDSITTLAPERDANYLQTLPEPIDQLGQLLAPEDGCASARGGCMLDEVAALFETYVVPPAIASRLWLTLASEPTITSLGHTTDRRGRKVVALTAPSLAPTEQVLLLVDPATGRYAGSERILVAPDANLGFDPPAVIAFTYLVQSERIEASEVPDDSATERF